MGNIFVVDENYKEDETTTAENPTKENPTKENPTQQTTVAQTTKAPTVSVGKTKITSGKRTKNKKKIKLSYKKVKGASWYEIWWSTSKKFTKNTTKKKETKKLKYTISKLKTSKKYYVKVRAFIVSKDGTRTNGKWTKTKKFK